MKLCVVFLCLILNITIAFSQQPVTVRNGDMLTNQDIIEMMSLGLSDEVILGKIRASKNTEFDTSLNGLRVLRAAKVSNVVIKQMIEPNGAAAVSLAPNTPEAITGMPDPTGNAYDVYYRTPNVQWITLNQLKVSGRVFRGFPSKGFEIFHWAEAQVRIGERRPVFLVRSIGPLDQAAWHFLQLEKKGEQREIQYYQETAFGGKSGISDKNRRDAVVKLITDRVLSVMPTADLVDGEYDLSDGPVDYDFGIAQ